MKKTFLFFTVTIFVLIVVFCAFYLSWYYANIPHLPKTVLVTPTPVAVSGTKLGVLPPSTKSIPTTAPYQINLEAPATQGSINEIARLKPSLPYSYSFTSTTGVPVEVFIPAGSLQDRSWVLKVEINGINYEVQPGDPTYTSMKESFKEAAAIVLGFLDKAGVNRQNIFVSWGDRAYIQDQAENWLKN